jgi:hypothetical protein
MKPRGIIETKSIAYTGERARKGCIFIYTVSGRGRFPDDMLRYDGVTVESRYAESPEQEVGFYFGDVRSVVVSGRGCTPERWRSFGWSVDPEIVERSASSF